MSGERPFKQEVEAWEVIFTPLLASGLSSQSCDATGSEAAARMERIVIATIVTCVIVTLCQSAYHVEFKHPVETGLGGERYKLQGDSQDLSTHARV